MAVNFIQVNIEFNKINLSHILIIFLNSIISKIQAHHHLKYHEKNVSSMTLHHTLLLLTRRNIKVGLLSFHS